MDLIVVGVDGSDVAQDALRWATAEARVHEAKLRIVHAWQFPYAGVSPYGGMAIDPADVEATARQVLEEAVGSADLTGLASPPETVLVAQSPSEALVEAAEGADLLVVGSRGRGGFSGLLLGSVSQQAATHATCPVVIVRHQLGRRS